MEQRASGATLRSLLLVRNAVSHDARVLRAARVAEKALHGKALVVGVATTQAPAGEARVEGVRVLRLKARGRAPGARLRRVLSGAAFARQALTLARRERPALVHANDWNTMWCGLAIKLTVGSCLIYDSHELWADRNGRWEWRPWLLASEALFVRMADAVLTASPGYADTLARRYRIPRPTVVRNIPEVARGNGAAREQVQPPCAMYIGGLMPGRGLEQTIDALALTEGIRVRMIGPGSAGYRTALTERARAAGVIERIEIEPPVPPAYVPALLGEAMAGLCLIQPVCRSYELTLPNKLFEYAAAGVPVLASDMPVIAAVVRDNGLGEVVPPEDPVEIAAGMRRLREPARWGEAARRARIFARANDWQGDAGTLAAVYTRVAQG
ncbi:MAG TPA: glycosyltransferase [Solirubrobacteraceae bacterium]|nr:glycosyltransferase [Solirubrobacteraceae bacterium]